MIVSVRRALRDLIQINGCQRVHAVFHKMLEYPYPVFHLLRSSRMNQFISDCVRDKHMVEQTCEDFRAIDQDEIMERTSVGNDDVVCHLL